MELTKPQISADFCFDSSSNFSCSVFGDSHLTQRPTAKNTFKATIESVGFFPFPYFKKPLYLLKESTIEKEFPKTKTEVTYNYPKYFTFPFQF